MSERLLGARVGATGAERGTAPALNEHDKVPPTIRSGKGDKNKDRKAALRAAFLKAKSKGTLGTGATEFEFGGSTGKHGQVVGGATKSSLLRQPRQPDHQKVTQAVERGQKDASLQHVKKGQGVGKLAQLDPQHRAGHKSPEWQPPHTAAATHRNHPLHQPHVPPKQAPTPIERLMSPMQVTLPA